MNKCQTEQCNPLQLSSPNDDGTKYIATTGVKHDPDVSITSITPPIDVSYTSTRSMVAILSGHWGNYLLFLPDLGWYACQGKSLVHPETPRVEQVGATAKAGSVSSKPAVVVYNFFVQLCVFLLHLHFRSGVGTFLWDFTKALFFFVSTGISHSGVMVSRGDSPKP